MNSLPAWHMLSFVFYIFRYCARFNYSDLILYDLISFDVLSVCLNKEMKKYCLLYIK